MKSALSPNVPAVNAWTNSLCETHMRRYAATTHKDPIDTGSEIRSLVREEVENDLVLGGGGRRGVLSGIGGRFCGGII